MPTTSTLRPPVIVLRAGRRRSLWLALAVLTAATLLAAWGLWQLLHGLGPLPLQVHLAGEDLGAQVQGWRAGGEWSVLEAGFGALAGGAALVVVALLCVLLLGLGLPLLLLGLLALAAVLLLALVGAPLLAALLAALLVALPVLLLVALPVLAVAGMVWLVLKLLL